MYEEGTKKPLHLLKLDDHIQLLKKLSRWKEPKKGKGKYICIIMS